MKKQKSSISSYVIPFSVFLVAGIAASILSAFIFSLLILSEKIPFTALSLCSYIATGIGCFVSTFLTSMNFNKKIFSSLIQGGLFFAVLYIAGSIISFRLAPSKTFLINLAICILCPVFSAILSSLFKHKKKRKH